MAASPVPASVQPSSLNPLTPVTTVEKPMGLTMRAALLSLGLAFFFGYIIPIIDMKMRNTFLGATHLPPGAVAVLVILLLTVNPLLTLIARQKSRVSLVFGALIVCAALSGFFWVRAGAASLMFWLFGAAAVLMLLTLALNLGRQPLSRNEILTVYISCLFSTLAPGHGAENVFVTNLIGPFYYATRENKYLDFMVPYLQPWMTPALDPATGGYAEANKALVDGWFNNSVTGQVPWGAWLVPLLVWGSAIALMYIMMACLSTMIRKQWAESEALAFPLLRLPLELTEDVDKPNSGAVIGSFFRNGMMWIGFGLAVFIQALRGLHLYFPDVPDFPLTLDTSQLFTEAPWNQIGGAPVFVWPVIVGITYLLTAEISFSFWFFYWFIKFQLIAAYLFGFPSAGLPQPIGAFGGGAKATFTFYQQIGCYFAYVGIILYTGREHFKHIFLRGLGRRKAGPEEHTEPMSYPLAFWGFVLSFGLLVGWSIAAGLTPVLAFGIWTLYVVIILALTRIIAEAGILFVQHGWYPLGTLGQITGAGPTHWLLGASSLPAAGTIQGALMTDLRGFIMPSFIQGFKLAHDRKIALKPLLVLMLACSLITMAMGVYMNVRMGYETGGLSLDPWTAGAASRLPADSTANLVKGVKDASYWNLGWVGLGIALTYGMMLARSRFAWFPLHPIGLLISQSYPIGQIWFSVFLGWLFKVLITKFGGTDSYRKGVPLFLGLALGDVMMMIFWLVIDGWQGKSGHKLMPG